jgi:hypothetical protein
MSKPKEPEMKKILSLAVLLIIAMSLIGCGGTKTVELDQLAANDVRPPDWYLDVPTHDDYLYAVGTEKSRDLQVAVDKAAVKGREELGKQLDLQLKAIESSFAEETGLQDDLELKTAYKSAVNVAVQKTLVGSSVKKKHLVQEGELWRAYVLMELPKDQIEKAIVAGVNANADLKAKIGNSEAFREIGG